MNGSTSLHEWLRGGKHSSAFLPDAVDWIAMHVSAQARILDAGCGNGDLVRMLAERGFHHLFGCDIEPGHIRVARRRAGEFGVFQESDFCKQRLFTGGFDLICAFNWLHNDWQAKHATGIAPRKEDPTRLDSLAENVKLSIVPGGRFVFDCLDPACRERLFELFPGWTREDLYATGRTIHILTEGG